MPQRSPTARTAPAWPLLLPLLPAAQPGGRPRTPARRAVVHARLSSLRSGCQWRRRPTGLPPSQTVYHDLRPGRRSGVWERLPDTWRGELRAAAGRPRESRAGLIDSPTGQTTAQGGAAAMTAASAAVGASAPAWALCSVSCWSGWSLRRGARSVMAPKQCSRRWARASRDRS